MKPIIALIDFITMHEGKKTLRYIEKHALWREFKIEREVFFS